MELTQNRYDVRDWGVDADKSKRPAYPMWKEPEEGTGAHWSTPEQQPHFHDFYSRERPRPTRVFGTSVPPKGLSGQVRKLAFKFSESEWEHWIILLFADRINMVEGIFDDLRHGVRPRFLEERGWQVDKKFKTRRYKKVVALSTVAVVGPLLYLLYRAGKSREAEAKTL